jgi:hypothetical protein
VPQACTTRTLLAERARYPVTGIDYKLSAGVAQCASARRAGREHAIRTGQVIVEIRNASVAALDKGKGVGLARLARCGSQHDDADDASKMSTVMKTV